MGREGRQGPCSHPQCRWGEADRTPDFISFSSPGASLPQKTGRRLCRELDQSLSLIREDKSCGDWAGPSSRPGRGRGVAETGSVWLPLALPAPSRRRSPSPPAHKPNGALGAFGCYSLGLPAPLVGLSTPLCRCTPAVTARESRFSDPNSPQAISSNSCSASPGERAG